MRRFVFYWSNAKGIIKEMHKLILIEGIFSCDLGIILISTSGREDCPDEVRKESNWNMEPLKPYSPP